MKRCSTCRKFLKAGWHHRECRACRKKIRSFGKHIQKVAKENMKLLSRTCEICEKKLPTVKAVKYTLDGKKLRDSVYSCEKCRTFLVRLGYT